MMKLLSLFLFLAACSSTPLAPPPSELPFASGVGRKPEAEAYARKFMISTDGEAASRAGAKMAELGGNAVDSAVAASFTISVERPQSTGLGGGGFLLLYLAKEKKTLAYDFREKAPRNASRDMFLDKAGNPVSGLSTNGPLASGVPGLVAGLLEVHRLHGKLPLKTVLAPAIELAEKGFPVYGAMAIALEDRKATLAQFPSTAEIFLRPDGSPLKEGDHLRQADLAETLRRIASSGRAGFYAGKTASAIVETMKKYGGLITARDLAQYNVKTRTAVRGNFLGHEIASMPPPSSGGIHVIEILNVIADDPLTRQSDPASIHLVSSAMQSAFADRAEYLGDSDFVKVPVKGLTDPAYAKQLRAAIGESARAAAAVKPGNPPGFEPDHTTHLNVMDAQGNTVATTQTINGWMGSGLVAEGTGIVMNNEMDDFSVKPGTANLFGALGGSKNAVTAEKRPLSSMSPTIVFKNGEPILAVGSPSGTRIITCVAQTILNRLAFNLPLYESIASIRYHHQWQPDEIRVDEPGFPAEVKADLERRGYRVNINNLGCRVSAVERKDGLLHGVADPRGEGLSLGL